DGLLASALLCGLSPQYPRQYWGSVSGTVKSMAQALGTPLKSAAVGARRDRASVRRDELINELIDLFVREGFRDLSIEDLARELKRSKSTLYSVADSKEQIFVAVARAFFRRATARIEERMRAVDEHGDDQRAGRIAS